MLAGGGKVMMKMDAFLLHRLMVVQINSPQINAFGAQ